jgi:hypothetical protein
MGLPRVAVLDWLYCLYPQQPNRWELVHEIRLHYFEIFWGVSLIQTSQVSVLLAAEG